MSGGRGRAEVAQVGGGRGRAEVAQISGGRRRWWSGACAIVLVAAVALSSAVPAPAAATNPKQGVGGGFTMEGSHGYRIFVLAGSRRKDGVGAIDLLVQRGRMGVSYATSATVTENSIEADLGALGRIDVQRVPSGEERHTGCHGKPVGYEPASYVGTVEFHGENGYTEASASTVPIDYPALMRLLCGELLVSELLTSGGLPGAALTVGGRRRDAPIRVEVHKNRRAGPTWLSATESEAREGVEITRAVSIVAGPGAFAYDPKLRWATLTPPAPFSGAGAFRRDAPKARRWSGDLSVDFPGDPDVPLAAPGMPVRLVHAEYSQMRG